MDCLNWRAFFDDIEQNYADDGSGVWRRKRDVLIILAHNETGTKADGTSDYTVEARVNERVIARLEVSGHVRASGAAELLRKIADEWDRSTENEQEG